MSAIKLRLDRGKVFAIGLMSGTSHDGVSAAVVELDERSRPPARLIAFRTFLYAARLRQELLAASANEKVGAAAISTLNFALGREFGRAAIEIARRARIAMSDIAFIGSHGHTFFHLPPRRAARGQIASTMQLGESAVIAAATGVPVVADFRTMDLALGGEGAPLAPLAHRWLFADPKRGRVVQNIGGIANATYIPPRARPGDADVIAFDTGPGNGMIAPLASRVSGGRMRMDRDGRLAANAQACEPLLAKLMQHPYFRRRPPKATGREEFGTHYLDEIARRASVARVLGDDLVATVTAF